MTTGAQPLDAAASVAESLSTVGYAMFALLQPGDLADVPSMSTFAQSLRQSIPSAPTATAHNPQGGDAPFAGDAAGAPTGPTFEPEREPDAIPVAQPVPQPVPQPVAQPVPQPVTQPDSRPRVSEPALAPTAHLGPDGSVLPVPKAPVAPLPEYNGKETLAMLKEISFLDE